MPRYRVETGNIEELVDAPDHESAFQVALNVAISRAEKESDAPEPIPGYLIEIIQVADGAEYEYASTERILRKMGLWREQPHA